MKIVGGLSRMKEGIIDWVNMILCMYENVMKLPTLCNNKIINKNPIRIYLRIYINIYIKVQSLAFNICFERNNLEQREGMSQWKREASRRHGGRLRPSDHDSPIGDTLQLRKLHFLWLFSKSDLKGILWTLIPEEPCLHTEVTKKLSLTPTPSPTI